jgi:hypothetical protein
MCWRARRGGAEGGQGFYAYQGRDKAGREDLPALIAAEAQALGIARRTLTKRCSSAASTCW